MYVETQRMHIRDYTMDDVNDLYDILGDAEVMKNCEPAYSFEKTWYAIGRNPAKSYKR